MIYKIYSVKDRLAGYGVVVLQDNDAVAMRAFENGCLDPSSTWASHPSDFDLYCLGEFDTHSGDIIPYEPKYICSANDFAVMKEFAADRSNVPNLFKED